MKTAELTKEEPIELQIVSLMVLINAISCSCLRLNGGMEGGRPTTMKCKKCIAYDRAIEVRESAITAQRDAHRAGMLKAADELEQRIEILEKLGAPGMYETAIHELKQRREAILVAANAK